MSQGMSTDRPSNETYHDPERQERFAELAGPTAVSAAAHDAIVSDTVPSVENMYGLVSAAARDQKNAAAETEAARVEAVKILEKETFTLGDLNPLINRTDLGRKESVDAIRHTTLEKIDQYDGLNPKQMESTVVFDPDTGNAELRFVARFEVPELDEDQLVLLEELVTQTYGLSVRTRTDSKGNDVPMTSYPPTQLGEEMRSKTGGWYMGPNLTPTNALHQGLFVFRDLGKISKDNFSESLDSTGRFIVEIREAGQYQTDLVTFITQVSAILSQRTMLDRGQLLYESYYDLIRLGLKKPETGSIYGMEEAASMIRRELIIPLASPEISGAINEQPQSVLMIGVPGTGKTLMVEQLLQEETGLFVLPIDPFELQKEVAKPKEKQSLMPRIAEVARITGKRVVLHVDDIENMVGADEVTNSTMLNLMAGVQESGFYIIASTNYPEKINNSLIQPQRFSVLIHCGLQNEQARYEILKIHADMESKRLRHPLFASEDIRDIILHEVARHAGNFTPRYLANIVTIAKSFLLERVAEEKGRLSELTEQDLTGHIFKVEDWEKAFAEVDAKYDSRGVADRDNELAKFVKKHSAQISGFASTESSDSRRVFSKSVLQRVVAAQAALKQEDEPQLLHTEAQQES